MKKLFFTFLVAGLAGCSSVSDIRAKAPEKEFTSEKTSIEVSQCILNSWQDHNHGLYSYGDVYIQPYHGGYSIYSDGHMDFVDVTKVDGITKVKLYRSSGLFDNRINKRIEAIQQCI